MIFLLGIFWPRATASAALTAAVGSALLSFAFKMVWPELPFIDRVGLVFVLCGLLAVVVSLWQGGEKQAGAIDLSEIEFGTTRAFNLSALIVSLILIALYTTWW